MTDDNNSVELATELTIAWLANPNTRTNVNDVPAFLRSMHDAVLRLNAPAAPAEEAAPVRDHAPAVTARKSLADPEYIISMIDGKPYKTLRRHLSTNGLTPEGYRQRYGLKADYPMVAANYSERRRAMAHRIGLGRKAAVDAPDAPAAAEGETAEPTSKPARKGVRAAKKAAQDHLGG